MQSKDAYPKTTSGPEYYEPTEEHVLGLWNHFHRLYGSKVVDKHDAELMKFIATFLSLSPGMTKEKFLNSFVTTVGKSIYIPFDLGAASANSWSLWSQMVTGIHEHVHIDQYKGVDSKRMMDFNKQYLLKKRRRARFEAEAYTVSLEMYYWRFGKTMKPDSLVNSMASYQLRRSDLDVARRTFEVNNLMIGQGAVITKCSHQAIEWFRAQGVLPYNER